MFIKGRFTIELGDVDLDPGPEKKTLKERTGKGHSNMFSCGSF